MKTKDIKKNDTVYEEGGEIFDISIEKKGENILLFCSTPDGPDIYLTVSKNNAINLKQSLEKVL